VGRSILGQQPPPSSLKKRTLKVPGKMEGHSPPIVTPRQLQMVVNRSGQFSQQRTDFARDRLDSGQPDWYLLRPDAGRNGVECYTKRLAVAHGQAGVKRAVIQNAGERLVVNDRASWPFQS
jgi:hypothetical protein